MSALATMMAKLTGKQIAPSDAEAMVAAMLPTLGRTPPERGVTGMLDAYSASPWLRAITAKVARAVGSTTWQLYATRSDASGRYFQATDLQQRGIERGALRRKEIDVPEGTELVPIFDHPLLRLLNMGAGGFPGATGRMLTQLYLELSGEAFWLLEMEGGIPVGYWIVPPIWIQSTPTPNEEYYLLESNTISLKVPREFMLWFVDPNPREPYRRGTGAMRTLGDEIDTDDYAAKYTRAFFYNQAQPPLLITAPGLKKEDSERFELRWMQKLRGFMNAHRPFFINREIKVTQLSQKFSEMQLIDLRKFERDMLINTRGIPPEVFGVIENSNRATIDAADYLFSKGVVDPALEFLRTYLQSNLVPRYDDRLILGYDSPVAEDKDFYLEAAKAAPWSLTMNEWRRLAGQDAVDYGDVHVFRLAEETRSPDMIAAIDEEEPEGPPPPPEPPEPPEAPDDEEGDEERSLMRIAQEHHHGCDCGCDSVGATRYRIVYNGDAEAVFKQLGGEEMALLADKLGGRMAEEVIIAFNDLRNAIDMRQLIALLEAGDVEAALRLITLADIEAALEPARQTLREALIVVGEASAAEVAEALGVEFAFEMTSAAAIQELEQFGASMVTNVSDESIEAIRAALHEGYAQGRTPSKIAQQIREFIGLTEAQTRQAMRLYDEWVEEFGEEAADAKLAKWTAKKIRDRAELIVDNELAFAANRGQEMTWELALEEGLLDPARTLRQWKINPGACPICIPMNNKTAKIGEPYENGVVTPNDIHVRCRCYEILTFSEA